MRLAQLRERTGTCVPVKLDLRSRGDRWEEVQPAEPETYIYRGATTAGSRIIRERALPRNTLLSNGGVLFPTRCRFTYAHAGWLGNTFSLRLDPNPLIRGIRCCEIASNFLECIRCSSDDRAGGIATRLETLVLLETLKNRRNSSGRVILPNTSRLRLK